MSNFLIEKLDIVDSTNDYLMREADEARINTDKVVIARQQTNGHGSQGRKFISDKDVGLYFSFIHFYKDSGETEFITQKAAVAVYQLFKERFDIELQIKWVNDLYYNGKKVCGILCKNLIKHNAVIIGIGIDLFMNENINEEIKDIAGYIFKDENDLGDCDTQYIVSGIVDNIYDLIKVKGLPRLYIEKNIIKDERIYEDYNLEC